MAQKFESRSAFVKEVLNELKRNHGQDKESFVFALSGKWGEGKTTFLSELQNMLCKEEDYVVIETMQPWKFRQDKVSLMKSLIIEMDRYSPKKGRLEKISEWINGGKDKKSEFLFSDTTSVWFHPGWLALAIFVGATVLSISLFVSKPEPWVSTIQLLLSLGLVPIIIKIGAVSQNKAAINASIDFDSIIQERLSNLDGKKIIILIDDLDRADPSTARFFLDNLRTFFDKPEISYVITGDHDVLEINLGRELIPHGKPPEQMEEGRRFLQKIFNLRWQLPLPLNTDLTSYIEDLFKGDADRIGSLLSEDDQKILKFWLGKYFSKNFRAIERFYKLVIFTLSLVSSANHGKSNKFVESLKKYPLLLVRLLMVQELGNPFFQEIQRNPNFLVTIEKEAAQGTQNKADLSVSHLSGKYTNTQIAFLSNFLMEKPQFYKGTDLLVHSIEPFIYLATDPNLVDMVGSDDSDFRTNLVNGNIQGLAGTFVLAGPERRKKLFSLCLGIINNDRDLQKRIEHAHSLINAVRQVENDTEIHEQYAKEFIQKVDWDTVITNAPIEPKMSFYQTLWQWMDQNYKEYPHAFDPVFILAPDDLHLKLLTLDNPGDATMEYMAEWFQRAYGIAKPFAMQKLLPKLLSWEPSLSKRFSEDFFNTLIKDSTSQEPYRNEIAALIFQSGNAAIIDNFKTAIFERIGIEMTSGSDSLWTWIAQHLLPQYGDDLKASELENAVIEQLGKINTNEHLKHALNWLVGKNQISATAIWNRVITSHIDAFINLWFNDQRMHNNRLRNIKPDPGQQNQILEKALAYIDALPIGDQGRRLLLLEPTLWLWEGMKDPNLDSIKKKLTDHTIRANARTLLSHWGQ